MANYCRFPGVDEKGSSNITSHINVPAQVFQTRRSSLLRNPFPNSEFDAVGRVGSGQQMDDWHQQKPLPLDIRQDLVPVRQGHEEVYVPGLVSTANDAI